MTTSGQTKHRPPLTREQQATVVQWRTLAIKYALKGLRRRGLGHFEDEAVGIAHAALMDAVRVWVPSRGSFPSCLKLWVASHANKFMAHGARTVHQSEHARQYTDAVSIDSSVRRHGPEAIDFDPGDVFVGGVLEDRSIGDPSESVDTRRLLRAAEVVLPLRVAGGRSGLLAKRSAQLSVELWAKRTLDGAPYEEIGAPHGLSRQAVQQRVARVQAAFEEWARPIREEAA